MAISKLNPVLLSISERELFNCDSRGLNSYQSVLQQAIIPEKNHNDAIHGHLESSQTYSNWYQFLDEGARNSEFRENTQYSSIMPPQRHMSSSPESAYFGQSGGDNYDR